MSRPRSKPRGNAPSPRSTRTARDNARARALGYASYYDYRLHDNGKIPPGPIRVTRAERSRLRGHRGRAAFLASLREGDLITLPYGISAVEFDEDARDGEGVYVEIVKQVLHERNGREEMFVLKRLTRDKLIDTIEEEQRRGAIFSPAPSLDQRRLVTIEEADGGY